MSPFDMPSGRRLTQLNMAAALMGNTQWKNTVAPQHDHTLGGEMAMVHTEFGSTFAKLHNCPRCGKTAADRYWTLALDEADHRLSNNLPGPGGIIHTFAADL